MGVDSVEGCGDFGELGLWVLGEVGDAVGELDTLGEDIGVGGVGGLDDTGEEVRDVPSLSETSSIGNFTFMNGPKKLTSQLYLKKDARRLGFQNESV